MALDVLALSERIYRRLLLAYPHTFRQEYGAEMTQVFRTHCQITYREAGAGGVLRLWPPMVWDWVWTAAREQMSSLFVFVHLPIWKEVRMRTNRMLGLIGGLILVLGSRLPWMSVPALFGVEGPTFEAIEIGWEGDGFITGGIGLILLFVGILQRRRIGKRYSIPGTILAVLAVLVVIGDFYRILEIGPDAGFFAATGVGIYVTLIGALLALVGALYRTPVDKKRQGTMFLSSSL